MKEKNNLLIFILTIGVFGIINTEMGVLGILPLLAEKFSISIAQAGLLVSLFALAVAAAGPVMPLLFAGIDRKQVMLLVLSVFVLGNLISVFTDNFAVMLLARVVPAIFHPVYCSLAFSVAAASVSPEAAPRAVAKVIVGVSAGSQYSGVDCDLVVYTIAACGSKAFVWAAAACFKEAGIMVFYCSRCVYEWSCLWSFWIFFRLSDQYHCFFVEYGKPDFTCLWFDEYRREFYCRPYA